MGRRANKKSKKKIKLTDKHTPTSMRKLCGRNMLKSGTYKSTDRFIEKTMANTRYGRMFTPDVVEYRAEMEQAIVVNAGDLHMGGDSIEDIRKAMRDISNADLRFPDIFIFELKTSNKVDYCAVCNMWLNYDYPEDYPDEWKFCCCCQPKARMLICGTLKPTTDRLKKIYDMITLVKGNVG